MEKMTKRAIQARETQAALIATAKTLVSQRGFDNVTIDEICRACGVSKGTFYHYFKTKFDIMELDRQDFLSNIDNVYRVEHEEDIVTSLVLMLNSYVQMVERRGVEMIRPNTAYLTGHYEFHDETDDHSIGYIIFALLENAVEENHLKKNTPISTIVSIITNYLFGLISNWCIQNGAFSAFERCCNDSLRMVSSLIDPYRVKKQS